MKTTKFLAIVLTLCTVFAFFVSCGDKKSDGKPSGEVNKTQETSKTQADFECGKKAYEELVLASDICEEMGNVVYDAWYFAIYEADDYSSYSVVREFSDEIGIPVADIEAGAKEVLGTYASSLGLFLDDISYAVQIATAAMVKNGTVEKLDTALNNAKAELKTMTQQYSDYSEYPALKSFYSTTDSYASFVKSPTGSFEQLKSTIENYENEIRTYRADLSFIFEE